MKIFYLLLLSFFISACSAQKMEKVSLSANDPNNLYVGDGDSTALYYYKIVPKDDIKGTLVILPSGVETTENTLKQISLHTIAAQKGLLVLIPSINWGGNDRTPEYALLDKIFNEIVAKYKVDKSKFVLGGLSNGGIIALSYAEEAVKNPAHFYLIPKAIFALDAPLDQARFYRYCEREIARNLVPNAVNEANWIKNNCDTMYGGSPDKFPEPYIAHSIYAFGAKNGGNAQYLKNIPVRIYTDLDANWLINERHRDLSDWNGTDIVAMINELNIMGNKNASVSISQGKGVRLDGTKNPHSWSIMDNQDCLDWVLKVIQ
jgi:hypothetical protein